jgi:hypothetical protein
MSSVAFVNVMLSVVMLNVVMLCAVASSRTIAYTMHVT